MDSVTEADVGQSVVETVVSIMPQVVPTTGSEVEQTEIPAIAVQQLIQAQATAAATTSVDSVTEADEGQSVIETVVSIMPQVAPIAGSKVEQTEIPAIADQQLIQAQATAVAASSVDPVTEADEGQSVVETVVSIMPEVVPTAGSKVEQTEIPDIADQPLMQAHATTEAADQEMIETQAAVQNSSGLDQSGDVVSQDLGRGWGGGAAKLIFDNYLPNWIWLVVDIYRDLKRWGKYPLLFIDTEVNSCLSIHLNREIIQHKKRVLS